MTVLHQLIAIRKGAAKRAEGDLTAAYHILQKPEPLAGITRTYVPRDTDGEQFPPQSTKVQVKVDDVIEHIRDSWVRMLDVTASMEATNAVAKADVVVPDGKGGTTVLLKDVPVATLLFLEHQMVDFRTVIAKLPTLDPSTDWDLDTNDGLWKTPPTVNAKMKKTPFNHELSPATKEHPRQVEVMYEDRPVGDWTTILSSGAIQAERKRELLDRVESLQRAVKFAREEANGREVVDSKVGDALFRHLFA